MPHLTKHSKSTVKITIVTEIWKLKRFFLCQNKMLKFGNFDLSSVFLPKVQTWAKNAQQKCFTLDKNA